MKAIARGPEFSADPGAVLVVPDALGSQLIAAGAADQVPETSAQTAVVESAEAPPAPEEAVADRRPARPFHRKR